MSDIVKIEVYIATNKVGSECTDFLEFYREEWDSWCEDVKEEVCRDAAFQMMEWGYKEVE